jgi:AcrR family transcriptional regulator
VIEQRPRKPASKAATANRAALIAAAQQAFATRGYDAPMSLIARDAGVGQGSLYRHFPDRESLVLAVFDADVSDIEALAVRPDSTLDDVLEVIVRQVTVSTAFIAMLAPRSGADARLVDVGQRMLALLDGKLADPRQRGSIRDDLQGGDLMLAVAMLAAVLMKTDESEREKVSARSWQLLRSGIRA